ncbi:MAG: MIP/aquaporin family protein [Terriglobales bacterium]
MKSKLAARLVAEFLGTLFLVAAVVGSGIMAERLAGGNAALALLANTIATGAALVALILTFAPISGAHLNPAVSLAMGMRLVTPWSEVASYIGSQFSGGILGTLLAHVMFAQPIFSFSHHPRAGWPQLISEFVATFGLLSVIWGCSRINSAMAIPVAIGSYITAAYWFTASTSFANPAVTVARSITDSFAGIRPVDVLPFMAAQIAGAVAATKLFDWLLPSEINEMSRSTTSLSPSLEEPRQISSATTSN